ncbi:hypothetical protein EVAR_20825_1 [Eumeta japonica]|uniref:Uncharacterized protein n=1 Tax=Eumeta variegata TaxID=151549 RepID=A0A4C1UDH2_EUMVA|nr:hypothetical protein EVAR_20825_1 [Eumeta japonica]
MGVESLPSKIRRRSGRGRTLPLITRALVDMFPLWRVNLRRQARAAGAGSGALFMFICSTGIYVRATNRALSGALAWSCRVDVVTL